VVAHRGAGALLLIVLLAGCNHHGATSSPLQRAVEQRGFDPVLARCVANSAEGQLGKPSANHLTPLLDSLPPDLDATLTKITADCAVTPRSAVTPARP
jgi:hypothetical protein